MYFFKRYFFVTGKYRYFFLIIEKKRYKIDLLIDKLTNSGKK